MINRKYSTDSAWGKARRQARKERKEVGKEKKRSRKGKVRRRKRG